MLVQKQLDLQHGHPLLGLVFLMHDSLIRVQYGNELPLTEVKDFGYVDGIADELPNYLAELNALTLGRGIEEGELGGWFSLPVLAHRALAKKLEFDLILHLIIHSPISSSYLQIRIK